MKGNGVGVYEEAEEARLTPQALRGRGADLPLCCICSEVFLDNLCFIVGSSEGAGSLCVVTWFRGREDCLCSRSCRHEPWGSSAMIANIAAISGEYFEAAEGNRGTRFNWYRDGSDWKPFHHDSAPELHAH